MIFQPDDNLNNVKPTQVEPKSKKILVLSGGGYRGLFSALFLQKLEDHFDKRVFEIFDLVVCTSTGSIVGAGCMIGLPASQVADKYKMLGKRIFPVYKTGIGEFFRQTIRNAKKAISAPYSTHNFSEILEKEFEKQYYNKQLIDFTENIVFTSVEFHEKRPILFSSNKLLNDVKQPTLKDGILASSAAPTFFNPYKFEEHRLIDGGIYANSPDMVAFQCARRIWGCSLDEISLLSIGTCSPSPRTALSKRNKGVLAWLFSSKNGIIQLALSTQEAASISQAQQIFGDNFFRVDGKPSSDEAKLLKHMDRCGETYDDLLTKLAQEQFELLKSSPFLNKNLM